MHITADTQALVAVTWAVVLATFVGPIAALVITFIRDHYGKQYDRRLFVFRTLMATRRVAISPEHVAALNLIEVDFYKCTKVEAAWKSYLDHLNTRVPEDADWRETKEKRLAELLFQMGRVLKFDIPALDLFKGGYAPQGMVHRDNRATEMMEFVHELSEGTKSVPIWLKGVTPPTQPTAEVWKEDK
ncbi:DUF6680 family protein [Burkholderia multivorans]|uniref:DUF6680 family protein n=1 Tax=Burkholderia multivorans TaxID=87883 RepID=UPI000D01927F|nr:DUF6680 family protein [Burkholderia multivorans]PRH48506.1 hypothetical protein C6V05_08755 [Burkholderia multivorans]